MATESAKLGLVGLRRVGAVVVALSLIALGVMLTRPQRPARFARALPCVATNSVDALRTFDGLVGFKAACAEIFAEDVSTWTQWSHPWFLSYYRRWPRYDWEQWYRDGHGRRQLILTIDLIPSAIEHANWLQLGASGAFQPYARSLAQNLVTAGLGRAVIRLGHEANGTWYPDSLGPTAGDAAMWAGFWRRTALAMKSVPGAHFQFDWCVNAGYRPTSLATFYPGDDVVNFIGVDSYDSGPGSGRTRIASILALPDGIDAVAAFARRHHKPLTIPEWGIGPSGTNGSVGDDPGYVEAIAGVMRTHPVAYQGYFFSEAWGQELDAAPNAIRAYRHLLGPRS